VVENQFNNQEQDAWSLYLYALKSSVTKQKYQKRLEKFFDFLGMEGATFEEKSKSFIKRIQTEEKNNGNNSQWKPDLAIGAWLYSSNYYVGASVQQLIPQNLYFSTDRSYNQSKTVPQYFLTAGVKIFMTDEITFLPSFLVKVIRPLPVTYDLNGKFSFSDKFWFGGSYRHGDSFGVLAGINVSSFVNVGYSYDITTSALNTVSNGTHEIVIGILLNNRYKVTCPQHQF